MKLYSHNKRGIIGILVLLVMMTSSLMAKELTIGASLSVPPFVIKDHDSGIELDILRQAFALVGYDVKIEYAPLKRALRDFSTGKLDGVINTTEQSGPAGFYSDPVITFENVAISLSKRNLNIQTSADLEPFAVVGFHTASQVLGDEYAKMAQNNAQYQELPNQRQQVMMLFLQRTDVIVAEKHIFKYILADLKRHGEYTSELGQGIELHRLFSPTQYQFVFADKQVRDAFNLGLRQLTDSGELAQIHQRYF